MPWIVAARVKSAGRVYAVRFCTVVVDTPVAVRPNILQADSTCIEE